MPAASRPSLRHRLRLSPLLTSRASGGGRFCFLGATDLGTKINWGVAFIVSTQFLGGMKMWYFLELNKLASARDIRRLELRMMQNAG